MPIPKKKENLVPKTARERVYQTLKEWIETNTLKPGEKIYDTELAAYFEVSRTPVREAMQLLADQKLIEIRPGKESIVTPIDVNPLQEIYQILGELNVLAIRFAFPKMTDKDIANLDALNQSIRQESYRNQIALDVAFHQYILDIASNSFLDTFCNMLNAHVTRFKLSAPEEILKYTPTEMVLSHQKIIDAMKSGNSELVEKYTRENFTYIADKIKKCTAK